MRWTIFFCLVFAAAGVLHAGEVHASAAAVADHLMSAPNDAKPVTGPCEESPAADADQDCALSPGCALFAATPPGALVLPVKERAIDCIRGRAIAGIAAIPHAPPPKFAVQS